MAHFSSLPIDILSMVTAKVYGGDVLRLWCTGDQQLQNTLANGGVTKVVFTDSGFHQKAKYPRYLCHLRKLRSLRFYCASTNFGDVYELGRQVQKLSPTLESLELTFDGAEKCLCVEPSPDDPIVQETVDDESTTGSETAATVRRQPLWDISKVFPRLRSMKLESDAFFVNEHIQQLPRTLEKLWLSVHSNLTPACIASLPPNLTQLYLPHRLTLELAQVKLLPRTLKALRSILENATLDVVQALPQAMDDLQIDVPVVSQAVVEALPRELGELYISALNEPEHTFDIPALMHLPPHLHTINLSISRELHQGVNEIVRVLPKTLTSFYLSNVDDAQPLDLNSSDWPPNLVKLHFARCTLTLFPSFLTHLPASIRSIQLHDILFAGDTCDSTQPGKECVATYNFLQKFGAPNLSQLTSFNFSNPQHSPVILDTPVPFPKSLLEFSWWGRLKFNEALWKSFPADGHLRYFLCDSESDFEVKSNGATDRMCDWEMLPRSLTTVDLVSYNPVPAREFGDFALSLPLGLHILEVAQWSATATPAFSKALPRTLTRLVAAAAQVTEEAFFEFLPPKLEDLRLKLVVSPITGSVFRHLPSTMDTLFVDQFPGLQDEDLGLLPHRIRRMYWESDGAPLLTIEAAAFLHAGLSYIGGADEIWEKYLELHDRKS